jgi:hypothetical protein
MTKRALSFGPRKPIDELAARRLEDAIAAKGESVAGQTDAVPHPRNPESVDPIAADPQREIGESAKALAGRVVAEAEPSPRAHELMSSRAHGSVTPRHHDVPATGIGTIHNPRVRKIDGLQTRATTVHLPIDLAIKLTTYCAQNGRKRNDVIIERLEMLLEL